MTEKRFTLDETFMITDNECMEIINPLMNSEDVAKVCELLNELHEENKELQQRNKEWIKYVHQLEITLKKGGY